MNHLVKDEMQVSTRPTMDDLMGEHDTEEVENGASTRKSVLSFWNGIGGLGVLSLLGSYAMNLVAAGLVFGFGLFLTANPDVRQTWFPYEYWRMIYGLERFLSNTLIPSTLLSLILPVLFWRGGLSQRFVLSAAIAIASMNALQGWYLRDNPFGMRFVRILQISACWISIPLLFRYAPLRTTKLRTMVATCIVFMALCISMLALKEAPNATEMFSWQIQFAVGFVFVLVRRNWGAVAFTEQVDGKIKIERTSTWVMLELMFIVGLMTSFLVWWIRRDRIYEPYPLIAAALLGFASSLFGLYYFRTILRTSDLGVVKFGQSMLLWIIATFVFAPFYALSLIQTFPSSWLTTPLAFIAVVSLVFSGLGSMLFVVLMTLGALWLRRCGWHNVEHIQ